MDRFLVEANKMYRRADLLYAYFNLNSIIEIEVELTGQTCPPDGRKSVETPWATAEHHLRYTIGN